MYSLAKAILKFSKESISDFEQQMTRLFAIFRGEKKEVLETGSFQVFVQLDSRVEDGFIHETNDGILIELGMNFSKSTVGEKVKVLKEGMIDQVWKILDGEAVLIFIPNDTERVHIATDPFGLFPLFFHKNETSLTLSTDLMGVLFTNPPLRSNLCTQSIIEFVSCHFIMENRTLFEKVFRVSEGSFVRFDYSTNSIEVEDWLTIPSTHEEKDIEFWIPEVSQRLTASIKKRVTPTSGTFLSGGMDSRVILASIPQKIRNQMKAVTFGVEGADDCRIAKKVAKRFGIDLHHMILDTDIFKDNFLKHICMSSGISNHMVAPIASAVSSLNVERIFDGFAGDAQFGGGFHNQTIDLESGSWP